METVVNTEQMNIFGCINDQYKIKKPIRLIELFAGIGSQAKALERLGADFEHYKAVEFDKFAIKSYNAIHGTNFETSDITQIHASDLEIKDTDQYEYIMTYSFPCQDLSLAGKQKGMSKGSNTRSGLLWEVERLLDECEELPQVLLMENVPQVIGKKNIEDFRQWQLKLESLGYSNFIEVLNAKDYGIPQNRKRCFMVSILGDYSYEFPKPFELKLRLKDVLEDKVDEKFYLSNKMAAYVFNLNKEAKGIGFSDGVDNSMINPNISNTLSAKSLGGHSQRSGTSTYVCKPYDICIKVGEMKKNIQPSIKHIGNVELGNNESNNRVYSPDGLSPTLNTMQGGHRQPKIIEPLICASRGRNPANPSSRKAGESTEQRIEINKKGLCNTLTTVQKDNLVLENKIIVGSTQKNAAINHDGVCPTLTGSMGAGGGHVPMHNYDFRIRKLTPLECWRLMGFDDDDCIKASEVNSNTQLYKQAGNSIVVNVLYYIFKQML